MELEFFFKAGYNSLDPNLLPFFTSFFPQSSRSFPTGSDILNNFGFAYANFAILMLYQNDPNVLFAALSQDNPSLLFFLSYFCELIANTET